MARPSLALSLLRTTLRSSAHPQHCIRFTTCHGNYRFSSFSSKPPPSDPHKAEPLSSDASYTQPSHTLSQSVTPAEKAAYDHTVASHVKKQLRSPWLREGADHSPIEKLEGKEKEREEGEEGAPPDDGQGSPPEDNAASSSTSSSTSIYPRGKLLTTPSRLLKLIIPLASRAQLAHDARDNGRRDLEPLALLVHPQQPLSYLERLVQSELPLLRDKEKSGESVPSVHFRAPDRPDEGDEEEGGGGGGSSSSKERESAADNSGGEDVSIIDGKRVRTGKVQERSDKDTAKEQSFTLPDPQEAASSDPATFVRWSSSTEIGDFIRDAARAGHFALNVEGYAAPILVAVPSFHDRTYYLRLRLRQASRKIGAYAETKRRCDAVAEQHARYVALGGGTALVVYWVIVYLGTFRTDLGWDVMEPVTYLVGLSMLIAGYVWFLVHNREVSYRSAMNFTISRRQQVLYDQAGFDVHRWEEVLDEANKLRREIRMIADEYDVRWDEREDAKSDAVIEALEAEREKKKRQKQEQREKEDDD